MRIRHIKAKGLFNLFDHSVLLNLDERITIIHGANGLGKTALLRLVNGFFKSMYSELEAIPFTSFEIAFDNGSQISIRKHREKSKGKGTVSRRRAGFTFNYVTQSGKQEEYHFDPDVFYQKDARWRHMVMDLQAYIPGLQRLPNGNWRYVPTGETLSIYEAIGRFQDSLPVYFRELLGEVEVQPEWFSKVKKSINVHFIQTQRLVSYNEPLQRHTSREAPTVTPAVQVYSKEITEAIKNTLTEYAELSQSLDSTFPERLMRQNREKNLPGDELRERLAALEIKRQGLQAIGLLEEEPGVRFEIPERLEPMTENVLSVYVRDVERKLKVFDVIASKIDLMRQIVDDHFLYKRLTMNRDKGFLFTNKDGHLLSPTQLSSGEQNELVLLYELLFQVKPQSLILIDEPEISLHVAWQQQFLNDLQQIIRLSPFDVLIATHAPLIIHDRWDLTVELQGPPEQKK